MSEPWEGFWQVASSKLEEEIVPFRNTVTVEGLAQALSGAQVVVDVSSGPSWEDNAVLASFEKPGRNLMTAWAASPSRWRKMKRFGFHRF